MYRHRPALLVLTILLLTGTYHLVGPSEARAQRLTVTVDSTASVIDYTGSATLHDWTGTSRSATGTILLDVEAPERSRAVIRTPVASFESGPSRRDRRMREVTEAGQYPMVEFRSTEIDPSAWGRSSDGHAGRWAVSGDLTFHGRTHPVDATVDVRVTDDSAFAQAEFPISLDRFGVERPELMWVAPIGDTIRIDARVAGAVEESRALASELETEHRETTGVRQISSPGLRPITPTEYAGQRASLHASVRIPEDSEPQWDIAFYGFAENPTGLAEAPVATLQADEHSIEPIDVEGRTRQLDAGQTVEIVRMVVSASTFETLAEALSVHATIGSARFVADWTARRDLRAILKKLDAPGPLSTQDDN